MVTLLIPLTQAKTSAAIEAIFTIVGSVLILTLHAAVSAAKARKLITKGEVQISQNDFSEGLGLIKVLIFERYVSMRGVIFIVVSLCYAILSVTILLGTGTSRCTSSGNGYAFITKPVITTCRIDMPIPGTLNMMALAGKEFRELITEFPDISVRKHPMNYDKNLDDITQFSELDIPFENEVVDVFTCRAKVIYNSTQNTISVDSEDILNAEGLGITAGPAVSVQFNGVGFDQSGNNGKGAVVYAKEISNSAGTYTFTVYGEDEGDNDFIEESKCTIIHSKEPGLQVLPYARYINSLADMVADPIRVTEVSWLAATLSQVGARQNECTRGNYKVKECTLVSNNTVNTLLITTLIAVITSAASLILKILNRKSKLQGVWTPYQMFASAALEDERLRGCAELKRTPVYASLRKVGSEGHLTWGSRQGEVAPEYTFSSIN